MKKIKYVFLMSLIVLVSVVFGYACSKKENYGTVRLDTEELTLTVGESTVITATVSKTGADVVWSVTETGVADVYNGLVKATSTGTTTVVATIGGSKVSASCRVTVVPKSLKNLKNIVAYKGDSSVNLALDISENYRIKAEKLEAGEYSDASALLTGTMFSTAEAGSYRITYTSGNETASCFVYVEEEKGYEDFFVIDALDGSTEFKSQVSQSSQEVLQEPVCDTTYSQYVREDVSEELAAAGYDGIVHNDMLYRIEKEVVKPLQGGTYFYLDVTPKSTDVFNKFDTFDRSAYLSVWYRVLCDADGTGYKPCTVSYDYLYRENKSGLKLIVNGTQVKALPSNNGWFNWKLNLDSIGEIIGSERLVFNVGQWAQGGKFRVDFYSVELVSPLLNELRAGREAYDDDRIEYSLPDPGMRNMNCLLEIYSGDTKLEENIDYKFYDYARISYIVDLAPGEYTLKYSLSADGLKTNSDGVYIIESPLKVKRAAITPLSVLDDMSAENANAYVNALTEFGKKIKVSDMETSVSGEARTLSDDELAAVRKAGYNGTNGNEYANRFTFGEEYTEKQCVYLPFDNGYGNEFLQKCIVSNADSLRVSVWLKVSKDISVEALDWLLMGQKSLIPCNIGWMPATLQANTWVRVTMDFVTFGAGYRYCRDEAEFCTGTENITVGLLFYGMSADALNGLTIDVYSAEFEMDEIAVGNGEAVSASFVEGVTLSDFEVYSAEQDRILDDGADYILKNGRITGLKAGKYELRFYVNGKRTIEGTYLTRKVTVIAPLSSATVLDGMTDAETVQAYIENTAVSTKYTGNGTKCETTIREISDEEYTALLNAGYDGEKTQKTAAQIAVSVMECDRANLYVRLGSTQTNEIFRAALEANYTDAYVSIWMKSSQKIDFTFQKAIFYADGAVGYDKEAWAGINGAPDTWIEVKIPLSSFVALGEPDGTTAYGFAFDYAHNGEEYLRGAKLDIWSVELRLSEKSAQAGTAVDISISEAVYGTYTIRVKDATGADATGVTVENGKITAENAGEYTIEYALNDARFQNGVIITRTLRVEPSL